METGTTVRRLLPEIALVAVTAAIVAGLLTMVGGKEAADSEASAWRAEQEANCTAAQTQVTTARQLLEQHAAATRGQAAPEAGTVNALVSGAGRMSDAIRQLSAEYRGPAIPDTGVDRLRAESVLTHSGSLGTAWNSLAAEYEDLAIQPTAAVQRVADWNLRAAAAAEQLRRAYADLGLTTCSRLTESMAPVA